MKRILLTIQLILSSLLIFAQGDIEVTLLDISLNPIQGAVITLKNESIGFEAQKISNAKGQATFTGLSTTGSYVVSSPETADHLDNVSQEIQLRSNFKRTVTLILPSTRKIQTEEITVSASNTTKINTHNAEVSSEIDIVKIKELPVEGRDITRMLYRLPNVTQATGFFPEAPNVSINGANGLFNNYLIDGMDNNEQFLGGIRFNVPVGFVQNVSVLTNNYSAEFGNTGNGIINITSKSGRNKFSGEAFVLSRPGFLDASSPFVQRDLSGNQVKDGFQRYQAGFGFGGAITENKTFYYVNFEHTTDLKDNLLNSPALGVNEVVRGENTFNLLSAKIDHLWSTKFKSSVRANIGLTAIGRQAGGLTGGISFPSAANAQKRNNFSITNKNVYFGDNFTSETNIQFARFRWDYAEPIDPNSPNVTVLGPTGETLALLGHPGYRFESIQNNLQFQQKFSWDLGTHQLKAGVEVLSVGHQLFGGGNPNGSYTVRLNQEQLNGIVSRNVGAALGINDIPSDATVIGYNVELRPSAYGTRQNIFSTYVEDQIQVSDRLNVSLGLRYDLDNLSKGGSDAYDLNNVAPRLSYNYRLGANSSFRGGYGMFYDKVLYAIYSDALQQNNNTEAFRKQIDYFVAQGLLPADTDFSRVSFEGNNGAGTFDNAGLPFGYLQGPAASSFEDQRNLFSNERRILNPNGYQNPYTHQFSLGYQLQMDADKLFYVDLVYNKGENQFRTRNLNAPSPWDYTQSEALGIARSSSWADSTRILPIYGNHAIINGERVDGVARNVVMTETRGQSNYYAASFNLQKERGKDNYAYRLIYTLSYLENNTEDINFRAMDANNFSNEWGPSINDRRHVINGIYNYYPTDRLTLTMAALLQSGQPINRIPNASQYRIVDSRGNSILDGAGNPIFTNDLNGDGGAFGDAYVGNSDRFPGEARNSDRLPWAATFDLGIQYFIPMGGGTDRGLEIRADVFNLFDAQNLSGYSNNAIQSNQIQVGSAASGLLVRRNAAPPRQVQFGVRYIF